MKISARRTISLFLIALCLLFFPRESRASGIISNAALTGIIVGIAAIGAGVVVVTYYAVRKPRTDGCVVATADGLALESTKGNHRVYKLSGSDGVLKPGERVKVVGRRKGLDGGQIITVSGVAKDYGPCPAH